MPQEKKKNNPTPNNAMNKTSHQQKTNQKFTGKQKASVVEIPHFLFNNYSFSAN